MTSDTVYQRLRSHLAYMGLPASAEVVAEHLDRAQKHKPSYTVFLEALLAVEVEATSARRLAGRLRFAHFPLLKTLEDFDFDAQPSLDRRLVDDLATLRFVEEGANLLCVGPPGVGKTHIALALALKAVEAGYRVYYTTAADLVARCHRAAMEGRWATTMRFYAGPGLLVCDELGYLPLPTEASAHIFQVVSRRAELGSSTIITTNRWITEWGEIFGDAMMAAAILDRFLHRSTVLQIDGDSYRMRSHRERLEKMRKGVAATTSG
ncbi:MAG: IS21-like element helper ATPase IstB [Thermoleophilaceae bacterium]